MDSGSLSAWIFSKCNRIDNGRVSFNTPASANFPVKTASFFQSFVCLLFKHHIEEN